MRSVIVIAVLVASSTWAWAEDEEGEDAEEEAEPEPKAKAKEEPEAKEADKPFKKQNLTGHADDGVTQQNLFAQDRFFVDKVEDEKSLERTVTQGSLTSTSFLYREVGGTFAAGESGVPSASPFTRLFTDLRLQTDFRHIAGGKWDARVDARGRFTADPGNTTSGLSTNVSQTLSTSSQSGFLGGNELDLRELWIARSGKRTDLFFGRQFVADLAGVKFDGLRFDYASSSKFTLFGFGGLFPIRGSRSITTDYKPLVSSTGESAGRFVATGGFGAAYRTENMYGAFGGVTIAPLSSEAPRVFGTSTGYWRVGPKMDFYHFAVLDALGDQAGLTNLSAGVNLKPDQRLRATFSVNRVDTETLNVQAQAFLANPENVAIINNESFIARIAQNAARASLSAGLGANQRFELTVATAFRYRGQFTLASPSANPVTVTLPPAQSAEIYASILDRRSIKGLRLGLDAVRTFRIGDVAYQRAATLAIRAHAARDLKNGQGEWEAEVAYSSNKDDQAGVVCDPGALQTCFGAAKSSILSMGGNLMYRINTRWLAMGSLFLNRMNITSVAGMVASSDPTVYGLTGYGRIALRF